MQTYGDPKRDQELPVLIGDFLCDPAPINEAEVTRRLNEHLRAVGSRSQMGSMAQLVGEPRQSEPQAKVTRKAVKRARDESEEDAVKQPNFFVPGIPLVDVTTEVKRLNDAEPDTPVQQRKKSSRKQKEGFDEKKKKERTGKWYDKTPFSRLLNYSDKRMMEFPGATETVDGKAAALLTRFGPRMKPSFVDFIQGQLAKVGRFFPPEVEKESGVSVGPFFYICTDVEVKKLAKTCNKKFLVCKCENGRLTRKERETKQKTTSSETREKIEVVALLWLEGEQFSTKRRKTSSDNGKLYIITDPTFLSGYMESWSKQMAAYKKYRELWDSSLSHESRDFTSVSNFVGWQMQKNDKEVGRTFTLSGNVRSAVAPCGVVFRDAWCDFAAFNDGSWNPFSSNSDYPQYLTKKIVMVSGKNPDPLRVPPKEPDPSIPEKIVPEFFYEPYFESFFSDN